MDFTHRTSSASSGIHNHPAASGPAPAMPAAAPAQAANSNGKSSHNQPSFPFGTSKWMRAALVALLFSLTIVAVGIIGLVYIGSTKESKYIDNSKYQAVFLTNDQVYFGHIKTINSKYIILQSIFYLNNQTAQTSSTSNSSSNLSLVKLGCEVHGPTDRMVINRDQVTFWENLRTNGQVTTAISSWIKQNPNGQTCSTTSSSTTQ